MLHNTGLHTHRVLALALPKLAAFLPLASFSALRPPLLRGLHVFARRPNADYVDVSISKKASVAVLKRAVIAELGLDMAPDRVRLLREEEGGGAPVLLDSRKLLAEQGVREGSSVVVEVMREYNDAGSLKEAGIAELKLEAATPDCQPLLRKIEGGGTPVLLGSLKLLAEQGVSEGSSCAPPTPSRHPCTALPYVLASRDSSVDPIKVHFAPYSDADDLRKAILDKLDLAVAPCSVRLLLKVEGGGAPVLLESLKLLAEQGVVKGSSVIVEKILTDLPYRLNASVGRPPKVSGKFCASTFAVLLKGRTMYRMRKCTGEDELIGIVVELGAARDAVASGDYLLLDFPNSMVGADSDEEDEE